MKNFATYFYYGNREFGFFNEIEVGRSSGSRGRRWLSFEEVFWGSLGCELRPGVYGTRPIQNATDYATGTQLFTLRDTLLFKLLAWIIGAGS